MLACNYHTYTDINDTDWVWWDAFNLSLSNTEDTIFDMLNDINTVQLKDTWLIAIFSDNDKNWDLRQSYNIYDIVDWYSKQDYINSWKSIWFGFIKLKD